MTDEGVRGIPLSDIKLIKTVIGDSIDNIHELLHDHLERLGESSAKNKAIANTYREQLVLAVKMYSRIV